MAAYTDRADGHITVREIRTIVIDAQMAPITVPAAETEIVIRVNGMPLTRLTRHRAARLGLIDEANSGY